MAVNAGVTFKSTDYSKDTAAIEKEIGLISASTIVTPQNEPNDKKVVMVKTS